MDSALETVTTARDGVTVERSLRRQQNVVVATFEVRAAEPAVVRIIDEFPGTLPVDAAGFNHDAHPDEGRIEDGRVVATVAVTDGSEQFVCGATLRRCPENVELQSPIVRTVEDIDPGDATEPPPPATGPPGLSAAADPARPPASTDSTGTVPDERPPESGSTPRDRSAPAGEPPAEAAPEAVDARLDALADRTAELAADIGDANRGAALQRIDALESALDDTAADVDAVRSELPSAAERLAELERVRLSVPTDADLETHDRDPPGPRRAPGPD